MIKFLKVIICKFVNELNLFLSNFGLAGFRWSWVVLVVLFLGGFGWVLVILAGFGLLWVGLANLEWF